MKIFRIIINLLIILNIELIKNVLTEVNNNKYLLYILAGHSSDVRVIVVLPNGDLAKIIIIITIVGSSDRTIVIWNTTNNIMRYRLTGHTNEVHCLEVLPSGDLASGSMDNTIKIWNPNTGTLKNNLIGHTSWVWLLKVLPNGDLASRSHDGTKMLL